jgi:tRNA 5-methylaminomethyl-2-thiouridine biosynthesis bifunctional protein
LTLKPARLQWSDDGSLRSLDYDDVYFQLKGAGTEESSYVFLENNRLEERFAALRPHESFCIAELGFGTGLNFLLTAALFDRCAPPTARLVYAGIEKHPIEKPDLTRIHGFFTELAPFSALLLAQYPPLIAGMHSLRFLNGRIRLQLALGDAGEVLPALDGKFDAWFLDGFAPAKNPGMWQESFYAAIAARTAAGGTLATFSSAGHVRRGLEAAGFAVRKVPGYGIKWNMTTAQKGKAPAAPQKPAPKNIAVLGAGLAGCAAARALAERGHRVVIVDRAESCATGASGNPVGILYPKLTVDPSPLGAYHDHAFCTARRWLEDLRPRHWRPCGVLRLDMTPDKSARSEELMHRQAYPQDYVTRLENGAKTGRTALYHPAAGMLSPAAFCAEMIDHAHIQKIYAAPVTRLQKSEKGWMLFDARDEAFLIADAVVIAMALDSTALAQTAWLPLQSLRGQMTLVKETEKSGALDRVICHAGYIAPAVDGLHSIGATFQKEAPVFPPEDRVEDDLENLQRLQEALPDMGFTEKDIAGRRTGYRAATPDKMPLIGPCPDYEAFRAAYGPLRDGPAEVILEEKPYIDGLYISTGFGAHGTTGATLAGEILAAMISNEPLPVLQSLMEYLLPERFILRGLKRREI